MTLTKHSNLRIEILKYFPRKKQCIMVLHYRDHMGNNRRISSDERFDSIEAGTSYLLSQYASEVAAAMADSFKLDLQADERKQALNKEYCEAAQREREANAKLKSNELLPYEREALERVANEAFIRQMQISPD